MSSDLSEFLNYLYNELRRLSNKVDSLSYSVTTAVSTIHSRIESLERTVANIVIELGRIEKSLQILNKRIENVRKELEKEISATRVYLEQRIENVRIELNNQINATRTYLEGRIVETEKRLNERIDKTEQRLDQHLAEQDRVLEIHGEGLLGSVVMQLMNSLIPRITPTTHVVVGQFNSYPLIVIEEADYIYMVYIVKEEDQGLIEQIRLFEDSLRRYTGKDVKRYILAMKPKEETPLWLARILDETSQLSSSRH
ncbi:hypothetical protein Igag_0816 [Ignisphaera aggregans DSM 17230]|uniref:DUF3782 domain-containing protein n=1 Tax=Ignisphaera aggregans (strain DSM 17230 / JCM 13409 / AQ1.S1) TaxID=583356 RepID=E0STM3_IGNAA|nr:hypothetical protein Igag_0816 [Ignisphaera aggregans DSM 17230]